MPDLLTLPAWEQVHPLVVHFPIVLLLVAPLFILAGALLSGDRGRAWLGAAFLMMLLGTAGAWVAVASGEAGEDAAKRVVGTKKLLHEHEELAELSRNAFTVLTLVFAAIIVAPRVLRREPSRLFSSVLPLIFLVPYLVAAGVLVNAAHHGGLLVHEHGVTAGWNSGAVPDSRSDRDDD